jgi:DNA polymerase
VGEGPGETEDQFGRPFIGHAGQLLSKIIEKMGYDRESVYITNVVKCRPPQNREPLADEVAACKPFLLRQIEVLRPRVIVCLGRVAVTHLLGREEGITRLRGQVFQFGEIPVVPTFHPSYILHQKEKEAVSKAKWQVWEDMQVVLGLLGKQA